MDQIQYATALRRDGIRMADAATDLSRRVPACPDWDVAELLWHTGRVHAFWRAIASRAIAGPDEFEAPTRPGEDELLGWFREGVEETASTLGGLAPDSPSWTWTDRQEAGFVQRRMAHETAVHCYDAVTAAGGDEPVEHELAVDGVDEFFAHFLSGSATEVGIDVHLHATDGESGVGEWHAAPDGDGWHIAHKHTKAAAAVRATASDLLLILWRRKGLADAQVFGDETGLARFLASSRLG